MKRLVLIIGGLLLVLLLGGYILLAGQFGTLGATITAAVEKATGKPLVLFGQPSLQFFPNIGVDMGKASWGTPDKDELAVSVRGAVVRVDLMELLHRRIVVKAINLDGLHVVVNVPAKKTDTRERNAQHTSELMTGLRSSGQSPTKDPDPSPLVTPLKEENPPASGGSFLNNLHLQEVNVSDGVLEIKDPVQDIRLSNLQVRVRELYSGSVAHADISMRGLLTPQMANTAAGTQSKPQPLEADLVLKVRLQPNFPVVQVQNLSLDLSPVQGLPLTKTLHVFGKATVDMALGSVSDVDMTAKLAGTTLHVSGHGTQRGQVGQFGQFGQFGTIKFEANGVLRDVLAACGMSYTPRDKNLLGAYNASGSLRVDKNGVQLDGLKGKLDATEFSGTIMADWPRRIAAKLNVDHVSVDGYLSEGSDRSATASAQSAAVLGQTPGQTPAQAKKTADSPPRVAGAGLSGIADSTGLSGPTGPAAGAVAVWPAVDLTLNVEQLYLAGIAASSVRSTASGRDGRYALANSSTLFGSAARIDLGADLMAGRYTLKSIMDKMNAAPLFKSLAGLEGISGQLGLRTDLTAQGFTEAALRRSVSGIATLSGAVDIDTRTLPADWIRSLRDVRTVSLDTVAATAKVDRGRVSLSPLTATGKTVSIQGQGQIDLPSDALDVRLNASLAGLSLPLLVRGTLAQPVFSLDAGGLIQNLLINPPKEGGKKIEDGLKNLLRGLR